MIKTRVSRCLFGPVDHDVVQKDLKAKLREITQEGCTKWNFDFSSDMPMRGYFDWKPDGDIPSFYNKVSIHSKPTSTTKCPHSRKGDAEAKCSSHLDPRRTRSGSSHQRNIKPNDIKNDALPSLMLNDARLLHVSTGDRVPYIENLATSRDSESFITNGDIKTSTVHTHSAKPPINPDKSISYNADCPVKFSKQSRHSVSSPQSIRSRDPSPKSSNPRTPSAFVWVKCKSTKGVAKRRVKSPRVASKKLRLTPITSIFRSTKLSHSHEKLSSKPDIPPGNRT